MSAIRLYTYILLENVIYYENQSNKYYFMCDYDNECNIHMGWLVNIYSLSYGDKTSLSWWNY